MDDPSAAARSEGERKRPGDSICKCDTGFPRAQKARCLQLEMSLSLQAASCNLPDHQAKQASVVLSNQGERMPASLQSLYQEPHQNTPKQA